LRALLAVGTRLAYDGQWWQVTEIDGPHVLLSSPAGVRRVSAGHLLADPSARLDGAPGDPVEGAGADLAGLGETEIAELRERVAHVQEVRTGFRRGCAELAAAGEPRPEYAPGVPMLARYAAKASEIGVGVSTLRRWVKDFGESGPAGLADDRWKRRREPLAGADPRWLEMARQVLAEHAEASKPTRDLVLAEIAARLDAGYDGGTVPVPSPTRARILLREISKGTSAFGGTKGKREIAGRPAPPYGRLRAVRPGEYLLLDTTRLDVFAMDPVTLRWVQAELTVAMDLFDRCITGLRVTPVSTKAVDAAAVLFESVRPLPEPAAGWADIRPPYHGLPSQLIIDASRLAGPDGTPLLPSVAAETVVVDHGKIYLSEHLLSACARLGISVQPARVYQATDKPRVAYCTSSERLAGRWRSCRSQGVVAASLVGGRRVGSGRVVEDFAFVVIPLPADNSGVVPDLDGAGGHAEQGGHLGERDQAGVEQPLAAAG
jgi:transposase InsO family protein